MVSEQLAGEDQHSRIHHRPPSHVDFDLQNAHFAGAAQGGLVLDLEAAISRFPRPFAFSSIGDEEGGRPLLLVAFAERPLDRVFSVGAVVSQDADGARCVRATVGFATELLELGRFHAASVYLPAVLLTNLPDDVVLLEREAMEAPSPWINGRWQAQSMLQLAADREELEVETREDRTITRSARLRRAQLSPLGQADIPFLLEIEARLATAGVGRRSRVTFDPLLYVQSLQEGPLLQRTVRIRDSGEIAGVVALYDADPTSGCASLAVYVDLPWIGTGLGAEAADALLEEAFRELPLNEVRGTSAKAVFDTYRISMLRGLEVIQTYPKLGWSSASDDHEVMWRIRRDAWLRWREARYTSSRGEFLDWVRDLAPHLSALSDGELLLVDLYDDLAGDSLVLMEALEIVEAIRGVELPDALISSWRTVGDLAAAAWQDCEA